jgi:two-component system sensor histidine kinase RpfC
MEDKLTRLKTIRDAVEKLKPRHATGNNEWEQALVHLIFAAAVLIYSYSATTSTAITQGIGPFSTAETLGLVYFTLIFLLATSLYFPSINRTLWRSATLGVDVVFLSASMALVPELATPLFFVYLWIIFGFGFRFGNRYLFAAAGSSFVGFAYALSVHGYWIEHRAVGLGLLASLFLLPAYVSFFIRRLGNAKRNLEVALEKADTANKAKSNFLANMSHELRTPLNGVITVSDLLLDTGLNANQREYADTIRDSSRTLLELINNVLDFSKIEAGAIEVDRVCFDLGICVESVLNIIRPLAKKKGLTAHVNMSHSTPRFIYGDPTRLKQILLNLANNAVKFTERGQISINVHATSLSEQRVHLVFELIDTGIGISPDAQKRVFERFKQEDESITRRYGGTGLGTTIAKQLVELMGGTIGLSSTVGKGSRFWFELDADVALTNDLAEGDADVLLVSDNDSNIETWRTLFNSWGINNALVGDVFTALEVAARWRTGAQKRRVVILDEPCLQMSPIKAAQLFQDFDHDQLVLALATMNPNTKYNPATSACFHHIFDLPVDSKQLYYVLKEEDIGDRNDQVIPLSAHYNVRSERTSRSLNILVAEDQPTNQFVFRRILEGQDHCVTIVADGQQALEALEAEPFDLAIVDLHMPTISGLEVITMFRFMAPESKMPFIIVTANIRKEVVDECSEYADGFLTKPIEKEQLLSLIHKVTKNKELVAGSIASPFSHLESEPLLDTDYLDYTWQTDFDAHFLADLFNAFRDDANRLITNLRQSLIDDKNVTQAKDYAHALKGIAGNVAAKRLESSAKHSERLIQTDPRLDEKADVIIRDLKKCLTESSESMRQYLVAKSSEKNQK